MNDILRHLLVIVLVAVLGAASIGKFRNPRRTNRSAEGLLPPGIGRWVMPVLPWVEGCVAIGLLTSDGIVFRSFAAAAIMLTFGFVVVVGIALVRGERPACQCFGIGDAPISSETLIRNLALFGVAAFSTTFTGWRGLPYELAALDANGWATAFVVVVLASGITVLHRRVRQLEQQVHGAATFPGTVAPTSIPDLVLNDAQSRSIRLRDMVAEHAHLLVFVSPGCPTCSEFAPLVNGWEAALDGEVRVRLVSLGDRAGAALEFPGLADEMFYDPGDVAPALRIPGVPAAVLLGNNGVVAAGPALGVDAISELLATVVQAITVNIVTGAAHQNQALREANAATVDLTVGSPLPNVPVRGEPGESMLHSVLTGEHVLLLWSVTCGYCAEILDDVRRHSARGEVIVLVDGDLAAVRAQGIVGPAWQVLAPGGAAGVLGAPGTPAAAVVRDGVVSGGTALGPEQIRRLIADATETAGRW